MKIINSWIKGIKNDIPESTLLELVTDSTPQVVSVAFTRKCNRKCPFCFYKKANGEDINLANIDRIDKVIQSASEMGIKHMIHAGRSLQPEHIPILKKHQEKMSLHLMTDGSAVKFLNDLRNSGIFFRGGIDVSVDGYKSNHESLRGVGSWHLAKRGLIDLRSIADYISIIGTASSINFKTISFDLNRLQQEIPVEKIQISTTIPAQHHRKRMYLTSQEMQILFENMQKSSTELILVLYRLEDLQAIFHLIPQKCTQHSFFLKWEIGKLSVIFVPSSILPAIEFSVDSDGRHIIPFATQWHIADRPKEMVMTDDFAIANPRKSHQVLTTTFWNIIGKKIFTKEKSLFKKYFQ